MKFRCRECEDPRLLPCDHVLLCFIGSRAKVSHFVVVYYCRTYEKAVSGGGEREKGGHVLRDTTSREGKKKKTLVTNRD